MVATKDRPLDVVGPAGTDALEVAVAGAPESRFTLWRGLLPERHGAVSHPALPGPGEAGVVDGDPAWLEPRPMGASLATMPAALPAPEAAILLADLAEALEALHQEGLCHGNLDPSKALVGPGGRVTLLGVTGRRIAPEEDLVALVRMGRTILACGAALPLPDVVPPRATELAEQLRDFCRETEEEDLRASLGDRARRLAPALPPEPEIIGFRPAPRGALLGTVDEVHMELGLSPPGESTESNTGLSAEGTGDSDATWSGLQIPASEGAGARGQALARALAPAPPPTPRSLPERYPNLSRLVLESPPDPLPTMPPAPRRTAPRPAPPGPGIGPRITLSSPLVPALLVLVILVELCLVVVGSITGAP